jgi:hypothetical protein
MPADKLAATVKVSLEIRMRVILDIHYEPGDPIRCTV